MTFQPRALDMVHRRTKGIPRLDQPGLRSRAARGVSRAGPIACRPTSCLQAAESLELIDESPSRFRLVPPPRVCLRGRCRRERVARSRRYDGRTGRARVFRECRREDVDR